MLALGLLGGVIFLLFRRKRAEPETGESSDAEGDGLSDGLESDSEGMDGLEAQGSNAEG